MLSQRKWTNKQIRCAKCGLPIEVSHVRRTDTEIATIAVCAKNAHTGCGHAQTVTRFARRKPEPPAVYVIDLVDLEQAS